MLCIEEEEDKVRRKKSSTASQSSGGPRDTKDNHTRELIVETLEKASRLNELNVSRKAEEEAHHKA